MALKAKDIAELTGVSTSTVSLVINNKPGVSLEKRNEILMKIKELGCEHLLKESNAAQEFIGFVVFRRKGTIINEAPFFAYFLQEISERLKSLRYGMSVLYLSNDMSYEEQSRVLQSSECKGFIIFAVEMIYEDMQVFKDSKLPFVMMDNSFLFNDVDTVAINNMYGIYKAVSYLYQRGHRKIGHIRSKVEINSFSERFIAYKAALDALGLPFNAEHVAHVGYTDAEAERDMRAYIERASSLPTAFICDNDVVACGALKGIRLSGLGVPQDISIIGFDDRPICTLVEPALTTMMVPKDAFGFNSVDLLVGKLRNKRNYAIKIEVGTALVERGSVASREPEEG